MKEIKKNYGLNWQRELNEQSEKDWFLGATSPICIAEIPPTERESCLPKGEVQEGQGDMMDCASRGPNNIIETKLNWLIKNKKISNKAVKFLQRFMNNGDVELSDAWVSINSCTTKNGNSMKAPLETIRKLGILPKKMLPLEEWMTWEEYHNPERITKGMVKIAKKSLEYFNFNYEKVLEKRIEDTLNRDILNLAGYAWPEPVNGEYPKVEDDPNHVFMGLKNPKTFIFDNYIDSVDGDFIKKLAFDYDFMDYGYRIIISEVKKKETLCAKVKELIKKYFNYDRRK